MDTGAIYRALQFIEDNLETPIMLDDVAAEAGYSKFHLNRLFSQVMGCTVHKYIAQRRLTKAARKLACTDMPIIDIALAAQYASQQSFTGAFIQGYGMPPQRYREAGRFYPLRVSFNQSHSAEIPSGQMAA